ncbi:MAG: UMP kinase, partial [Nitrospira sp.]
MTAPKYQRILLKISGELLAGQQGYGIEPAVLDAIADEIASVVAMDVEVAVVIGGGNIFRGEGLARSGMDRVTG